MRTVPEHLLEVGLQCAEIQQGLVDVKDDDARHNGTSLSSVLTALSGRASATNDGSSGRRVLRVRRWCLHGTTGPSVRMHGGEVHRSRPPRLSVDFARRIVQSLDSTGPVWKPETQSTVSLGAESRG